MAEAYCSGFDAHTHLDFADFDSDRTEVMERARAAGVTDYLLAGARPQDWDRLMRVADEIGAYAVLGIHPWWVRPESWQEQVAQLESRLTPWGIGETGLDKNRPHRDEQLAAFRAQLELAAHHNLPVVLHCVRSYGTLLDEVERHGVRGMVHAWSGPLELVERAVSLGLSLSFGGLVFRSERVRQCAVAVPPEALLLETDCPDQPIPGEERGEPAHLRRIAEWVAPLRGLATDELLELTGRNARQWLGLQK